MIAFICLFLPALASVWLYETVSGTRLPGRKWAYRYGTYVLVINFVVFAVKAFVLGSANAPMYELATDMLPSAALNYLIMSIPVGVALVLAEALLGRMLTARLEADVKKNEIEP